MTHMSTNPGIGIAGRWSRIMHDHGQEIVVVAAMAAIAIVAGFVEPRFFAAANLNSIFAGNAYIAVAAIGMSMVIIAGHIDVSIGVLIGALAVVAGLMAVNGWPVWLCWLVPVLLGAGIEALTGAIIAYGGVPSIVVTLGTMSVIKGALIMFAGGNWISNMPPGFMLAQMRFLGLPASIWVMVLATAAAAWWMANTRFGRSIYAIGGNPEAAVASGLPVKRRTVQIFAIHGAFAGLAALLFATQIQVIQTTAPASLELTVITASVIGGVSILGGRGTVVGSTLAALLFGIISSALVFLGVSAFWLRAVLGTLIIVTVLADMARRGWK